jgi:hypothetical protein
MGRDYIADRGLFEGHWGQSREELFHEEEQEMQLIAPNDQQSFLSDRFNRLPQGSPLPTNNPMALPVLLMIRLIKRPLLMMLGYYC